MPQPIVIVGSLNMDFVVQMPKLPGPGQTLCGEGFQMLPGGKGANQACAAGRLGGRSKMIGRVGADIFGEQQRISLGAAGVDTSWVLATEGSATGVALIFVEIGGENMIVIASGANGKLQPEDLQVAQTLFEPGFLLLQLETPLETVAAAAAQGKKGGMTVILDPAPAQSLSKDLLQNVDLLTPNETEALALLGRPSRELALAEATQVARELLLLGPGDVILKLGSKGAWWANGTASRHFPACRVDAVDATAAGDTFNGALAVALAEGKTIEEAIPFANAAAALSVTRLGAQASIPHREEVERWLREYRF
jgi:ribokinase